MPLVVTAHPSMAVSKGLHFHSTSGIWNYKTCLSSLKELVTAEKNPNPCVLTSIWQLVRTSQSTVSKYVFEFSMFGCRSTN